MRKSIKFPLKMKNGAEVRSLEELQTNADIESIMKYYFSGQLTRWCKAFDYIEIPETFEEINAAFIKSICDSLKIHISNDDIREYICNGFGVLEISRVREETEQKEEIIDDAYIKEKLKAYTSYNLDDYEISAVPVENENGMIGKYRISVACEKTEQYSRFSIPYEITESYSKERFEQDLYRKISNCVRRLEEEKTYNQSIFSTMDVGQKFLFGRWENNAIEWEVIRKDIDSLYVICTKILCERTFSEKNINTWETSDIRIWLNQNFYNNAFNPKEKDYIGNIVNDKVSLLTDEEARNLLNQSKRNLSTRWWLRTPYFTYRNDASLHSWVWFVYDNGDFCNHGVRASETHGVRPVLSLKF